LTLAVDIGTMQIKPNTFENFTGLISEYLEDVDLQPDEKVFGTGKDWIYDWTDNVYELSNVNYMLMRKSGIVPPLGKKGRGIVYQEPDINSNNQRLEQLLPEDIRRLTFASGIPEEWFFRSDDVLRNPQAGSRFLRELFLAQLVEQGHEVREPLTWGQIKESIGSFLEKMREYSNFESYLTKQREATKQGG
ncbi:MAG: hypothetical protein L7F78_18715, partial [Syntrophales bacterium LBB04]|nr:hypothetical protein [Syntrophales bacterium LBB04]